MNIDSNDNHSSLWVGDFHLHTNHSIDGTITPQQLVKRAVEVGLTCLAVTDHDTITGAVEVQSIAPFPVIIGEEISSTEGHIIGLFLQEKINPGLSVAETIAAIREQGGLAIAPHPFVRLARGDRLGSAFLKNASLFDIVEVRNSNNPIASDCQKALDYSLAHGMPTLAGSDAHHLSGVGSARNFLPTFTTPTEFLSAVRKAHFMASCHPARYFARMILNQIRIRL